MAFPEINQSSVYLAAFSGKLSPVTTHSEAQVQIEPIPTPEQGAQPAAESATLTQSREVSGPQSREVGGREGPEPTRFGDWELRGRCIDF